MRPNFLPSFEPIYKVLLLPTNAMASRREVIWSEWEESNLIPWLDAYRALSWKARADAYYKQHGVYRSVESLRGKMYHILRKRLHAGATPHGLGIQKRPRSIRCSVGGKASPATVPSKSPTQDTIDRCYQEEIMTQPRYTDSNNLTQTEDLRPGATDPFFVIIYKLTFYHRQCNASTYPFAVWRDTVVNSNLGIRALRQCSQEVEIAVNEIQFGRKGT